MDVERDPYGGDRLDQADTILLPHSSNNSEALLPDIQRYLLDVVEDLRDECILGWKAVEPDRANGFEFSWSSGCDFTEGGSASVYTNKIFSFASVGNHLRFRLEVSYNVDPQEEEDEQLREYLFEREQEIDLGNLHAFKTYDLVIDSKTGEIVDVDYKAELIADDSPDPPADGEPLNDEEEPLLGAYEYEMGHLGTKQARELIGYLPTHREF